jgi:hypothetical protein
VTGRPPPPTDATLAQAFAWPGPGRKATTAHPLCTCRKAVDYPARPGMDWDAHRACTSPAERRAWWRQEVERLRVLEDAWREECKRVRRAARCPLHDRTPSIWGMST